MARLWDWVSGTPDRKWGGGVYALYRAGQLVYVGRTACFFVRIPMHRRRFAFDAIKVAPIKSLAEQRILERRLLYRLRPTDNRRLPTTMNDVNWYRER